MIHVQFNDRSYDLDENEIGLYPRDNDEEVLKVLAWHFDAGLAQFQDYIVDRSIMDVIIVRPGR